MIPDNAPQWLKDADTENAVVEILDKYPYVIWRSGTWKGGLWEDGIWEYGLWKGGLWKGGLWKGGTWKGGSTTLRSKYIPLITQNGTIQIGCETKTVAEWDAWFAGTDEFETKRGTPEFDLIQAHYEGVKAYKLFLDKKKGNDNETT